MNCPSCGAPVADGMSFCTNCGAQFNTQYQQPGMQYQQPQQPGVQYQQPGVQYQQPQQQYQQPGVQYQQPQQQYQQPQQQYQQPGPGMQPQPNQFQNQTMGAPRRPFSVIDIIKQDPIRVCTYVGFFFLFLVSWFPRWVKSGGSGAGLFASDGGILKLWGILLLLIAIWGIMLELNAPGLEAITNVYKKLPFSQFYLPAASLLIYFLATFNGTFRQIVNLGKLYGGLLGGSTGYGFCMWFCLFGVILITVRPVMALIKKENYWQ